MASCERRSGVPGREGWLRGNASCLFLLCLEFCFGLSPFAGCSCHACSRVVRQSFSSTSTLVTRVAYAGQFPAPTRVVARALGDRRAEKPKRTKTGISWTSDNMLRVPGRGGQQRRRPLLPFPSARS